MFHELWQRFLTWWKKININTDILQTEVSLSDGTARANCEKILNVLKPLLEKPYQPRIGAQITVSVIRSDFNELIQQLRGINLSLNENKHLTIAQCGGTLTETSLDSLFVAKDRSYIGRTQIISFFDEALKLCHLTQGYEQAEYGKEEHNFRMLSAVFYSTRNVSAGLLEALL